MLISLEGLPGAGKSTQGRMLAERLQREGTRTCYLPDLETQVTDELGDHLFELFALSGDPFRRSGDITTDTFLAAAIRAHVLATRIQPALEAGYTVIEDRGAHTMYSYSLAGVIQHHRMDVCEAIRWLKACGALAGREADISILLLLPPELAAKRVAQRPGRPWNDEELVFLGYVDQAYRRLEAVDPQLVAVDTATLTAAEVHSVVYSLVTAPAAGSEWTPARATGRGPVLPCPPRPCRYPCPVQMLAPPAAAVESRCTSRQPC